MRRAMVAALAGAAARAAQSPPPAMRKLPLRSALGEGRERQVEVLFEGPRRKLVQITLRNGAVLARHSAPVPITIQCVAGSGTLHAGDGGEAAALEPGSFFTLEPKVMHEVKASPAVSILLTQFTGD